MIFAVIVLVGGATWYWNNGRSSSQEAFVVRSNGKILVTTDEWATAQAGNKKFAELSPGAELSLDAIVDRRLEYAEAEKRGTTCTTEEATTKLKEGQDAVDTSDSVLGHKITLYNVESSGHAPAGYSLTPEAARTPALIDAIKAYESDPKVIEGYRKQCSIGRLYASLAPDGNVRTQTANLSALKSKLRIDAGLEYGSAATPPPIAATATP